MRQTKAPFSEKRNALTYLRIHPVIKTILKLPLRDYRLKLTVCEDQLKLTRARNNDLGIAMVLLLTVSLV